MFEINENEPCWGDVDVVEEVMLGDDDYFWIHACQGHIACYDGGKYKPET